MSGFNVSDSGNSFSILSTGDLDVAGDVSISGNFNNRLAEKTITLFSFS